MSDLIATRASLIHRLKNWQDQSSWQDFFDTYWKLIYDVARRSGLTDAEAHDALQETMISVARRMPDFQYDPATGSFKAWLLNLTRWRITDQLRKRNRFPHSGSSSDDTATGVGTVSGLIDPESEDISKLWDAEWERNLLDTAIARVKRRIDPKKYQIFDLCANKGWRADKVAAAFRVPVGQVYLAKHRVTRMIKTEVKRLKKEAAGPVHLPLP